MLNIRKPLKYIMVLANDDPTRSGAFINKSKTQKKTKD